jgi:hypothetical protein
LVAVCVLGSVAAFAGWTQTRSATAEPPCSEVFRRSIWDTAAVAGPATSDINPQIRRAMAQFRFHRRSEALASLISLDARLHGEYGQRLPDQKRTALVASLGELRDCFRQSDPAPLADVTVRVFIGASDPDDRGPHAGQGVLILVDDVIGGRTTREGTLTLRLPSGPIELRAEVHGDVGAMGEAAADLAPGASGEVVIILGEGNHPAYQTELVLLEAIHDTVPGPSRSFTLQFRENGVAVPVARLIDVELLDADLREQEFLTERFRAARGQIVARNAPDLLAKLPKDTWMYLSVTGRDATGVHRHNVVRLRVTASSGVK